MEILVDSNLLVRLANVADPQNTDAAGAIKKLRQAGNVLYLVPQNIYEFWSVATRPALLNGLGMTVVEVQSKISSFRQLFSLRLDDPAISFSGSNWLGHMPSSARMCTTRDSSRR